MDFETPIILFPIKKECIKFADNKDPFDEGEWRTPPGERIIDTAPSPEEQVEFKETGVGEDLLNIRPSDLKNVEDIKELRISPINIDTIRALPNKEFTFNRDDAPYNIKNSILLGDHTKVNNLGDIVDTIQKRILHYLNSIHSDMQDKEKYILLIQFGPAGEENTVPTILFVKEENPELYLIDISGIFALISTKTKITILSGWFNQYAWFSPVEGFSPDNMFNIPIDQFQANIKENTLIRINPTSVGISHYESMREDSLFYSSQISPELFDFMQEKGISITQLPTLGFPMLKSIDNIFYLSNQLIKEMQEYFSHREYRPKILNQKYIDRILKSQETILDSTVSHILDYFSLFGLISDDPQDKFAELSVNLREVFPKYIDEIRYKGNSSSMDEFKKQLELFKQKIFLQLYEQQAREYSIKTSGSDTNYNKQLLDLISLVDNKIAYLKSMLQISEDIYIPMYTEFQQDKIPIKESHKDIYSILETMILDDITSLSGGMRKLPVLKPIIDLILNNENKGFTKPNSRLLDEEDDLVSTFEGISDREFEALTPQAQQVIYENKEKLKKLRENPEYQNQKTKQREYNTKRRLLDKYKKINQEYGSFSLILNWPNINDESSRNRLIELLDNLLSNYQIKELDKIKSHIRMQHSIHAVNKMNTEIHTLAGGAVRIRKSQYYRIAKMQQEEV
jgi:hypothetical protein